MQTTIPIQLTVHRKAFVDALALAARVTPRRSLNRKLAYVLITADPDKGTTIQATDLETSITVPVLGVKTDRPARLCLHAGELARALGGKSEECTIRTDPDGRIAVAGPYATFLVPSENPDDFPRVARMADDAPFLEVMAADMAQAIERTIGNVEHEDSRYALGGVCVRRTGDKGARMANNLTFEATNRKTLATQRIDAQPMAFNGKTPGDFPNHGKPVIPAGAAHAMLAALEYSCKRAGAAKKARERWAQSSRVAFMVDDAQLAHFRTDCGIKVSTRLMEGRFPNTDDLWNGGEPLQRVTVSQNDLHAAVKLAVPAAAKQHKSQTRDRCPQIRLKLETRQGQHVATLRVQAGPEDHPSFDAPIVAVIHDDWKMDFTLSLEAQRLETLVAPLVEKNGAADFGISYHGRHKAVEFQFDRGWRGIIMPLTRDAEEEHAAEDARVAEMRDRAQDSQTAGADDTARDTGQEADTEADTEADPELDALAAFGLAPICGGGHNGPESLQAVQAVQDAPGQADSPPDDVWAVQTTDASPGPLAGAGLGWPGWPTRRGWSR